MTTAAFRSSTAIKASKLRSSIDHRKHRISSSKNEAKRKSVKKVNAFLKDVAANCQRAASETEVSKLGMSAKKQLNYNAVEAKTKSGNIDSIEPMNPQACAQNPVYQHRQLSTLDLIAHNQGQYRVTTSLKQSSALDYLRHLDKQTPAKFNKNVFNYNLKLSKFFEFIFCLGN